MKTKLMITTLVQNNRLVPKVKLITKSISILIIEIATQTDTIYKPCNALITMHSYIQQHHTCTLHTLSHTLQIKENDFDNHTMFILQYIIYTQDTTYSLFDLERNIGWYSLNYLICTCAFLNFTILSNNP